MVNKKRCMEEKEFDIFLKQLFCNHKYGSGNWKSYGDYNVCFGVLRCTKCGAIY